MPKEYEDLKDIKNLVYAGFVNDVDVYYKGADLFINPVNSGGGLKTKLVEAIGFWFVCGIIQKRCYGRAGRNSRFKIKNR